MKIIKTDNFDRDYISDLLIAENVNKGFAECLVEQLNNTYSGCNSPDFFKLVPDDYKLHKFQP